MRSWGLVFLAAACVWAQKISPQEKEALEKALSEAGSSPVEYLRAIEKHLQEYPDSPRKEELLRAAARAAIEANDDRRIVLYGERLLANQPDDLQVLERVTRALLAGEPSKEAAETALKHALHEEEVIRKMQNSGGGRSGMSGAEWKVQTSRAIRRALVFEARAQGILGRAEAALGLAQRAFETDPSAEAAREIARAYERLNRPGEAARAWADAFTIPDPQTTDADRARDRGRMGEMYRKAKGTDAGLGDLMLAAYDRNLALIHTRELQLRADDPNALLSDPMEFTLSGPDGGRLTLTSLKGKVVVFDFWATWCGPCRVQHPLYDEVKKRFSDGGVVFVSISTDDDRSLVKPFLAEVKWNDPVYFEDGLARALKISSIPTTIVVGRDGKIFSRMNGFVPERFVEALSARIRDALSER